MQKIIIEPAQAGQRFDKFLGRHLCQAGMSFIYKMLRKKNITLNGKKSDGREQLKSGDEVCFFFAEDTYAKFTAVCGLNGGLQTDSYEKAYDSLKDIEILYEDTEVLFLNKPAGLLSQKAQKSDQSVNEWMIGYLLQKGEISKASLSGFRPSICNRLDRNTSGILLCGKTLIGSRELNRLIQEREVHKYYQLFVKGTLTKGSILEGYLSKDEVHNKVFLQNIQTQQKKQDENALRTGDYHKKSGEYIKTGYQPLLLSEGKPAVTFLEAELFTGKTHQIRAHLASIGHPLAGDYKYGDAAFNRYFKETYRVQSQLLHAVRMEFPKTCRGLPQLNGMIVKAPLPAVFETILKKEHFIGVSTWQPGIPEVFEAPPLRI